MTPGVSGHDLPTHGLGWKDDECVQVNSCNGAPTDVIINIYDWCACPVCGKELKLVQHNDVLIRETS